MANFLGRVQSAADPGLVILDVGGSKIGCRRKVIAPAWRLRLAQGRSNCLSFDVICESNEFPRFYNLSELFAGREGREGADAPAAAHLPLVCMAEPAMTEPNVLLHKRSEPDPSTHGQELGSWCPPLWVHENFMRGTIQERTRTGYD